MSLLGRTLTFSVSLSGSQTRPAYPNHPDQTPCDPLQSLRLIIVTLEAGAFHFGDHLPHGLL